MTEPAPFPSFTLRPETFFLDLALNGRTAGEMAWQIAPDKHAWVARVQTDFGGVLPDLRRVQTSRLHPQTLTSLGYLEGDGRKSTFETAVDRRSGVLTVKQGRDEASAPLLTDLHDPVSVLLWLRALDSTALDSADLNGAALNSAALDSAERAEVWMTGGRVHVRRLADAEVQDVAARVYELRPGGALVYVEDGASRRLLKLVQPTDFGPVEAILRAERPRTRSEAPRRRRR